MKKAVFLINLGTPDSPNIPEVKRYLGEFLMDPLVIDIPWPLRWFLVNLLILPKRPASTSEAYRKIWTEEGSPLWIHHKNLAENVARHLGESWIVEPVMRYGNPSIRSAVEKLRASRVEEIILAPLYPQYTLSATESSLRESKKHLNEILPKIPVKILEPFFKHNKFIKSFAGVARKNLSDFDHDFMLFSFHGLPERHVKKLDESGVHCLTHSACCTVETVHNQSCYRAQCFVTAELIARELNLPREKYAVTFQSRLGSAPWIKPYTDEMLVNLAKKGVKRLAVMCPAFVADCLETLEEIDIRVKQSFLDSGGQDLRMVPSLNSGEEWSATVAQLILEASKSKIK